MLIATTVMTINYKVLYLTWGVWTCKVDNPCKIRFLILALLKTIYLNKEVSNNKVKWKQKTFFFKYNSFSEGL